MANIIDIHQDPIFPTTWDELVNGLEDRGVTGITPNTQPTIKDVGGGMSLMTNNLQSPNYKAGTNGWRLFSNGDVEFESGKFRGDITIGSGENVFKADSQGIYLGSATFANAPFSVSMAGALKSESGEIGGWTIGATTLSTTNLTIDSANEKIESDNYLAGSSGFTIGSDLIEAQNIISRGTIRGSTFTYDMISAVGGQLMVSDADSLASDMTALDASTLTTKGDTTFAVNDMLVMRAVATSGIQEEWLRVTAVGSAPTYTVTRDLAGVFSANANPVWKAGTPVVKQGSSDGSSTYSGGWLRLLGEGTNSPHYSVFGRTGVAYNGSTELVRMGNLNGIGGETTDVYGFFAGDSTSYFKWNGSSLTATNMGIVNVMTAGETITGGTLPEPIYINTIPTSASELDVSVPNNNYTRDLWGSLWWGQSFKISALKNTLEKVSVSLGANYNSPTGDVTMNIYLASSNVPTGSSLGSKTITPTASAWNDFTFDTPIPVGPGLTYFFTVEASTGTDTSNRYRTQNDNTTGYSDGQGASSTNSGSSWTTDAGLDMTFKTYTSSDLVAGDVWLADADNSIKLAYTGFATTTASDTESIDVQFTGVVDGFSGLSIGSVYYLDNEMDFIEQTNFSNGADVSFGFNTSNYKYGQTFLYEEEVADSGLKSIKLNIDKKGSPTDNLIVKLYASNKTTLLATSNPVDGSTTGSDTVITFTFSTPYRMVTGTEYFFNIERTGALSGANYYGLNRSAYSVYADGDLYYWNDSAGTWDVQSTTDAYMILHIDSILSTSAGANTVKVGRAISATGLLIYQLAI